MKKLLAAMFVALLMVGCGEEAVEGVRKSEELIGGQIFIVTKNRENVKLGLVVVKVFDEDGIAKIRTEAKSILEHLLARVDEDSRWDEFKEGWIDSTIAEVTPSAGAKTDADGRFLFSPPSDKFMLAATSSRLTGDEQEKYRWLEVFQRDSIGPLGLLLSNDNLLGDLAGSPAFPSDARNRFDAAVAKEKMKRLIGKPITVTSASMEMLWVKPGTFEIGRSSGGSHHTVTLTDGYWLGKQEVTQAQWEKVMGSNPSNFKGANRPVENVSWTEVTAFCEKLTELEHTAGRLPAGMAYQLPTEAQWEYACRAGTKTAYAFGDELTAAQANLKGGPGETTDVGKYPANAWGFHDMHGNVWEWCADWYGNYPSGAVRDPVGPTGGAGRVIRGGSWSLTADDARSALRCRDVPAFRRGHNSLGFRLSLRPPASQ